MVQRIVREVVAGALVLAGMLVPDAVFSEYLSYETYAPAYVGAEISVMVLKSVFIVIALLYVAWRVREFAARDE